jgi:23S rRNA (cytidine2498-2'-O)-methyltransferase
LIGSAYLAAPEFEVPLAEELERRGVTISSWHGRLALSPDPPVTSAWALEVWTAPRLIEITSIKQAADSLRAIQRNWGAYEVSHHRRMALIAGHLPPLKRRLLQFPESSPTGHLGAWTLLDPATMLASHTTTSPFVNGEILFEEDHIGPPSRAYLKLWEACTRMGCWPLPGDRCIDLGATPGGWTWAIAKLGAQVLAIDKAPLALKIAAMPGVSFRVGSAFAEPPAPVDWLFCDVIAYPERSLRMVQNWIEAGAPQHIVCSIKFQGATDHAAAEAFAAIPGGQVVHLGYNKHELTFLWSACVP